MTKQEMLPNMKSGMKTKSAPKSKKGGIIASKSALDVLPKPGSKPQKVAKHTSKWKHPKKDSSVKGVTGK